MIEAKVKDWMECGVCSALVYSDDATCCVCHSDLKGRLRAPTDVALLPETA